MVPFLLREHPMNLCLNMIVKNESARIERALVSAAPFIHSYVICDTGSTDDTKDKINKFFTAHNKPGVVYGDVPFVDWSQARNTALDLARASPAEPDYYLLMDADMELVVKDAEKFMQWRDGASYDMFQQAGVTKYLNRRLISGHATGKYIGVTHEYLDVPTAGTIGDDVASFIDHADGANRPEKFKRDIRLLLADLKVHPERERSMFYLANSFRDAGKPERAAMWYQRRIAAGGWDEEVWQSEVYLAHCYKDMGREGDFIRTLLSAYNRRPTRAEPMYDLAHHYRLKGMNAPALACAEAVVNLPASNDALFVNDYVYNVGIKEEIAISAFYVPQSRQRGYKVANDLSLKQGPYAASRSLARANLYYYVLPISEFCPSFKWREIDFTAPEGYVAMNPSVTLHNEMLHCNVRCVNYRMDAEGRYLIKGTDGTANAENPINTRNFVLYIGNDPFTETHPWGSELLPPGNFPCEFPLVTGFEDLRLISWQGDLWGSSTVRQIHPDGNCEQVLTRLLPTQRAYGEGPCYTHTDMYRMLRTPRETEKNWAPMVLNASQDSLRFMWRPGETVSIQGTTIDKFDTGLDTGHISGSSQVVACMDGGLAVVHEAHCLPGSHLRYYTHRFALYGHQGKLLKLSLPFVFHGRHIEFCAGMCWHPNGRDLVLSYGYKDEQARIATIDYAEVRKMLCP